MIPALAVLLATPARRTAALLFAANGFLLAGWLTRLPAVQGGLGLGHDVLGLALLGLALGTLVGMPAASRLIARHDAGPVAWRAALLFCATLPGPALAGSAAGLVLALTLLGLANGVLAVAMNVAAAGIEARAGTDLMAGLHAMFSLGGVAGAVAGSLIAWSGVAPLPHLTLLAAAALLLVLARRDTLADTGPSPLPPAFARPRRPLAGLALVAFAVMLGEGAVADWSAVHLVTELGADPRWAGLGYALFGIGMTLGRLCGDSLRACLGEACLMRAGALLGAVGLGLGLGSGQLAPAALGYACLGLGLAGIGPIVLRRAATVPGIPAAVGVAAVASVGFIGFVVGPPLIGLLAEATSLGTALGVVPLLAVGVASIAGRALRAVGVEPPSRTRVPLRLPALLPSPVPLRASAPLHGGILP